MKNFALFLIISACLLVVVWNKHEHGDFARSKIVAVTNWEIATNTIAMEKTLAELKEANSNLQTQLAQQQLVLMWSSGQIKGQFRKVAIVRDGRITNETAFVPDESSVAAPIAAHPKPPPMPTNSLIRDKSSKRTN